MDFSKYPSSGKFYSGAEMKKGICISGKNYIVKFPKNSPEGLTFSHISEYLGSHLFAMAGIPTQETLLGTYNGKTVVVMKDFIGEGEQFVPFNEVGDSSLECDKERYQYSYNDILRMLRENQKLTNTAKTCKHFWDMYILDAWIGNFDRHGANWGFLKKNNSYQIAPVFDNGSSLFPKLNTDEKLLRILQSSEEMEKRIHLFPTSQIKLNGRKSSYYEVIASRQFAECNKAVIRMYHRISLSDTKHFIQNMDMISEIRKTFYIEMLKLRYKKFIQEPYHLLD